MDSKTTRPIYLSSKDIASSFSLWDVSSMVNLRLSERFFEQSDLKRLAENAESCQTNALKKIASRLYFHRKRK